MNLSKFRPDWFYRSLLLVMLFGAPVSASAATEAAPASRCITAATRAMYATMVAQEAKDVAPYVDKDGMRAAIEIYKQQMDIAWSAMGDSYCGYGDFGAKSAIHSFQKTAERVRSAFLDRAAQYRKTGIVAVIAPVAAPLSTIVDAPVVAMPTVAPAPVVNEVAKTNTAEAIVRGLHEGLRGDDVLRLQRLIATILKIPQNDPYITGYFGAMTKKRVIIFQIQTGIIHSENDAGAGFIGPRTVAALNTLK